VKVFGKNQVQQEKCKFLEYRPKGVIDSIRKFLGKSYNTEDDPTCIYLHKETRGYLRKFYLCPHQGNLGECKKVRTIDQKLKEYEESRRRAEANRPLGIIDAVDRINTFVTLEDYEIIFSKNYGDHSLLQSLRKKAGISNICVDGRFLDDVIRILEKPPFTKEKIEYISALREATTGKLDPSKYRTDHVGSNLRFVKFESRKPEHEPYK